jgi:hypothetical protein
MSGNNATPPPAPASSSEDAEAVQKAAADMSHEEIMAHAGVVTFAPQAEMTDKQREDAYKSLMMVGGGMQELSDVCWKDEWGARYGERGEEEEEEEDEDYIAPDLVLRAKQELEKLRLEAKEAVTQRRPAAGGAVSGCELPPRSPTMLEKARQQCVQVNGELEVLERQVMEEQKTELLQKLADRERSVQTELERDRAAHKAKVEARLALRRAHSKGALPGVGQAVVA